MPCFENAESSPAEFGKLTSCCEELIIRRETDFLHDQVMIGKGEVILNLKKGKFGLDYIRKYFIHSEDSEVCLFCFIFRTRILL